MSPETKCTLGTITYDFHADGHIDPPTSHYWVWGLNGMLVCCMLLGAFHRARSLYWARGADAAVNPDEKLAPGSRFVCGKVEYADGQTNAISVHVEQLGTETKTKNGWKHAWQEVDRRIEAQPFYVRRPNGERIRIEPGDDPLLIDKPDEMKWHARDRRTRIAALTPGEDVIVQGTLTQGPDPEAQQVGDYRSTRQGWIMTRFRNARMEVSTEKRGERHRKRARAFSSTIAALFWVAGFVNLFFVYYHIRLFEGEDTCARITRKDISITKDSKGRTTHHYDVYLDVDAPGRPQLNDELDYDDWNVVEKEMILGFRYVPNRPTKSTLGTDVSTNFMTIIFAALVGAVGLAVYTGTRSYKRWYEGKLENTGSGPLPDRPSGT